MERVKTAIGIVKENYIALMSIALAYSVLELGLMKIVSPYMGTQSIETIFSGGIAFVGVALLFFEFVRIVFIMGFLPMILTSVDGKKLNIASFKTFLTKKRFINVFALELVILPVFMAGLLLLVLPGAYWFVITIFAYFIVVSDLDAGTFESISKSIQQTKGFRWAILGYSVVFMVVSFFASLVPVVSIIVDTLLTPVFYTVLALIYRESLEKNA